MVIPVTFNNNVKVYDVSGYNPKTDLLKSKSKKNMKNDIEWQQRIELIQDFEFPEAANRLKYTPNGKYIVATGVYKPQIRVFDVTEMSIKFERHTSAETVQFQILDEDWTKLALLQMDRSIELHSQFGKHHSVRIPRTGRDLVYNHCSAEIYAVGSSSEIYRLNLQQGRFLKSFESSSSALNFVKVSPAHGLIAAGGIGIDGNHCPVDFWDPRSRSKVGTLSVDSTIRPELIIKNKEIEATAFEFLPDGLTIAIGSSTGHVSIFDLRSPNALLTKDHQYGLPIKNIAYHSKSKNIVSSDSKAIRVWNKDSGKFFTAIESSTSYGDINDVCIHEESGLVIVPSEAKKIPIYFIPEIGPAPLWASFLENLTEEMEEESQENKTQWENYKFLTREELSQLALDHLIGTNVLKAYMHGYFIDVRLYEKAKSIANPFAYEEYKKAQIKAKLDREAASRIKTKSDARLPKVNKKFASKLLDNDKEEISKSTENPLKDSRFDDLFNDPDFQIDEDSVEYKLLHPSESKKEILEEENLEDYESLKSSNETTLNSVKKEKKHTLFSVKENDQPTTNNLTFSERLELKNSKNNKSNNTRGHVPKFPAKFKNSRK